MPDSRRAMPALTTVTQVFKSFLAQLQRMLTSVMYPANQVRYSHFYGSCKLRAMAMRTGNRPHYRWNEIQPRHFKALAQSLSDPKLWSMMLETARSVPEAIASVSKRLPPDSKESVWISVTKGLARKAEEFSRAAKDPRD